MVDSSKTPLGPVDTGTRRPLPAASGIVGRVALFLAAFAAVGAFFRAVASPDGGGLVGSKREFYAANAQRFDTVFLGTSHVYRGFVPEEFDRALSEAGLPSASFNYGVQLPNLIEEHYLLREILELGEGRLKRVFLEYQTLTPQLDPENDFIPRALYWHDLDGTLAAVESSRRWDDLLGGGLTYAEARDGSHSIFRVVADRLPPVWRVSLMHVQHFHVRALMLGRGKDVARGLLGRQHGQTARHGPGRGYVSLEEEERRLVAAGQPANPYQKRRDTFRAEPEAYLEKVRALDAEAAVFGDEEWMNADLVQVHDLDVLRGMAADARAAGVELVLVVMPANSCDRELEQRLQDELDIPVLRYNLPAEYPELYDAARRFDSGHLSAEGALDFTRLLARDFVALTQ